MISLPHFVHYPPVVLTPFIANLSPIDFCHILCCGIPTNSSRFFLSSLYVVFDCSNRFGPLIRTSCLTSHLSDMPGYARTICSSGQETSFLMVWMNLSKSCGEKDWSFQENILATVLGVWIVPFPDGIYTGHPNHFTDMKSGNFTSIKSTLVSLECSLSLTAFDTNTVFPGSFMPMCAILGGKASTLAPWHLGICKIPSDLTLFAYHHWTWHSRS